VKIALLTPSFKGYNAREGGIASHFAELAEALCKQRHSVTVVTPLPKSKCIAESEAHSVVFAPFSADMPLWLDKITALRWQLHSVAGALYRAKTAAKAMVRLDAASRFDVVETTNSGCLAMSYVKFRARAPLVTRVSTTAAQLVSHNNSRPRWRDRIEQRWESRLVHLSDRLVTHTLHHRDEICRQWNLKRENIGIVPHGIRIPERDELYPTKETGQIEVLYVGRLEHRKGIDILLEAIPTVLANQPQTRFKIVGLDTGNWQKLFWELNRDVPRDRVAFSGSIDDIQLREAYRRCDLFVAPSRYESFGLIYAEAMAWGKPVIGCNVGGVPEVIAHGESGLIISAVDSQALSKAIIKLIIDAKLRAQLGEGARIRVENRFSHTKLASGSITLYNTVISMRS
jgi:glycosyltransferase involved in cell wall biosynthesis